MVIAIALLVIVVGSVLFHLLTLWWSTRWRLAWPRWTARCTSRWSHRRLLRAINLFVVYTLWRFRHPQQAAARLTSREPQARARLIVLTTIGIVAAAGAGVEGVCALRAAARGRDAARGAGHCSGNGTTALLERTQLGPPTRASSRRRTPTAWTRPTPAAAATC
jgi:hypothetical protein